MVFLRIANNLSVFQNSKYFLPSSLFFRNNLLKISIPVVPIFPNAIKYENGKDPINRDARDDVHNVSIN